MPAPAWASPGQIPRDTFSFMPDTSILSSTALFRGLPEPELRALAALMRTRRVARGARLWREEDAADTLYVLVRGSIKVFRWGPDGEQMVVKFRAARDMKKSVLGAGPFRIVLLFQLAGVVEQDG